MAKFFKAASAVVCALSIAVFTLVFFADRRVPDEFTAASYSDLETGKMLRLDLEDAERSDSKPGRYNINVSILDLIPVKSSVLELKERKYVVPGGNVIGLKLYTKGVVIVGTGEIESGGGKANPAKAAGVQKGDAIISINSVRLTSAAQAAEIFASSAGKTLRLVCERNGKEFETDFNTVMSKADGSYKAGMWIRDSAAGIGTMTYFDEQNGVFASLGHAVCDIDTGKCVNISCGECVPAQITGCNPGRNGQAGELCGIFADGSYGRVLMNCDGGAYGRLSCGCPQNEKIPVAASCEVKTGCAQIISTVDGEGTDKYDVEITRLYNPSGNENRCMSIKVTDSRLIEKTGGIVQGMSGSPIIQNGMLVGAVTHVFVNDPTQGYGIYAEKMLAYSELASLLPDSDAA